MEGDGSKTMQECTAGSQDRQAFLGRRRSWTRCHFTFASAPCGGAESDADYKCRDAADGPQDAGSVGDQRGDQSEV
jgi:hypothetical protein